MKKLMITHSAFGTERLYCIFLKFIYILHYN